MLAGFILLSIGLFKFLADGLHLSVQYFFILPNLFELAVDLVLGIFELLDLRLNRGQLLGMRDRIFELCNLLDDPALSISTHCCGCKSALQILDLLVHILDVSGLGMHLFEEGFLFGLERVDLLLHFVHLSLRSPLLLSDTLGHVDLLSQFALASVLFAGATASFTDSVSLLDELIFTAASLLDELVLLGHISVELILGRFLQKVLFGWQIWDDGVFGKGDLLVFLAFHVMEFVDPAILVLSTVVVAWAIASFTTTSASAAATTTATSAFCGTFALFSSLGSVGSLASSLWSAFATATRSSAASLVLLFNLVLTSAPATSGSLRPGVGVVASRSAIVTCILLATAATSTGRRLLDFLAHCLQLIAFLKIK